MALIPPKTKVVIVPLEPPEISEGGIYRPDHLKRRPTTGVVIYKGPNVTEVKVGDHVLFGAYSGDKVSIEGEGQFLVMYEEDLLGIVSERMFEPLIPLSTVRRVMAERLDEIKREEGWYYPIMARFNEDVIDRLKMLPMSEGFEF